MRWLIAALAVTLTLSSPCLARAEVVTEVDWVEKPSGDQLGAAYPTAARLLGIEGSVALKCIVTAGGLLENCRADNETPSEFGFSAAALSLIPYFRLRPEVRDGRSVTSDVTIPINFSLPDEVVLTAVDAPISPRAAALARDYVNLIGTAESVRRLYGLKGQVIEVVRTSGTTPDLRKTAAAATRAAAEGRLEEILERRAGRYAAFFNEQELSGLIKFARSTPQPFLLDSREDVSRLDGKLSREFRRRLQVAARSAFCRQRTCTPDSDFGLPRAGQGGPKVTIPTPIWLERPTFEQIDSARPLMAWRLSLEGRVLLACSVAQLGGLDTCQVIEESPAGLGFGASAIRMKGYFRLSPAVMQSDTGDAVAVQVRFRPPNVVIEAMTEPRPKSDRALMLARKFISASFDIPWRQAQADNEMRELQATRMDGVDAETRDVAIAAIRSAADEAWNEMLEFAAKAYAAEFDENDLKRSVEFIGTPEGKALMSRRRQLDRQIGSDFEAYDRIIAADAGRAVCRLRGCRGPKAGWIRPPAASIRKS